MHDTEWESRRPKASINVSDIIDDRTIDGRTGMRTPMVTPRAKDSDRFEPNEITGRSTACGQQLKHIRDGSATSYHHSPTVEEILATSIATNIRDLCSSFRSVDVNNSDGEGLTNHHQRLSFRESRPQDSFTSEEFVPADRVSFNLNNPSKNNTCIGAMNGLKIMGAIFIVDRCVLEWKKTKNNGKTNLEFCPHPIQVQQPLPLTAETRLRCPVSHRADMGIVITETIFQWETSFRGDVKTCGK